MRLPSSPDEPKRPRDPSYPDRARIDSDVREFMRQPSTPWIVFDRDSRVDRDEVGAILPVARSSILPDHGVFPPSLESVLNEPVVDPSNVVVATDLSDGPTPYLLTPCAVEEAPPSLEPRSPRFLLIGAIAGAIGLIAMVACVVGTRPDALKPAAAAAPPRATVPAEPSPPNLDIPPPPVDENAPVTTTTPAPPEPVTDKADKTETDPKKKFGRLTIKGAASGKQIFMDGKRMLGTGQRTFTVFCGEHTIAVNDKDATRDVNIPCNGELSITR